MKLSVGSWILIILLLAGVGTGIYFLWPKVNFAQAFDNINDVNEIVLKVDVKDKTVFDYADELQQMCLDNELFERASKLNILNNIIDIQNNSQKQVFGALLVIDKSSGKYGELTNKQNKAVDECKIAFKDFQSYIKGAYAEFLSIENPTSTYVFEYADPFISKYQFLVLKLAEFYEITAEIVLTSTQESMEHNTLTKTANKEITLAAKRLLNYEQNVSEFLTFSNTLKQKAEVCYGDYYYSKYFTEQNKQTFLENLKTELTAIAPQQA